MCKNIYLHCGLIFLSIVDGDFFQDAAILFIMHFLFLEKLYKIHNGSGKDWLPGQFKQAFKALIVIIHINIVSSRCTKMMF